MFTGTLPSEDPSRSGGMPGSMPGGQGEMDTEWWGEVMGWVGGWGVVSAAVQLYWLRLTSSMTPDVAI